MNICSEITGTCVETFITIVIFLCFAILFVTTCTISICEMFEKKVSRSEKSEKRNEKSEKRNERKRIFFIGKTEPPNYEDVI
jgi:hypothetical protein